MKRGWASLPGLEMENNAVSVHSICFWQKEDIVLKAEGFATSINTYAEGAN